MNKIKYIFNESLTGLYRNKTTVYTSILILSVSILFIILMLLLSENLKEVLNNFKKKTTLFAYLIEDYNNKEKTKITEFLTNNSLIGKVKFYSKQQALEELKKNSTDLPELIQYLPKNPLPAYFEIDLKKPDNKNFEIIAKELKLYDNIESIDYGKRSITILTKISQKITIVTFIIIILFTVLSIYIFYNTIKLSAFDRINKIDILKLVGATPLFIKMPFLIESFYKAVIACLISFGLSYLIYNNFLKQIQYLPMFDFKFIFLPLETFVIIFVITLLISFLGSFIAISGFLNIGYENE